MQFFGSLKALKGTLRIPLSIQAQQINGVIAEEVGEDIDRTCSLLWNFQHLRHINFFGSAFDGEPQTRNAAELPLPGKLQHIGNFPGAIALLWELALRGHNFIVFHKRLQDHRITSQAPTSITPFFITARKKVG